MSGEKEWSADQVDLIIGGFPMSGFAEGSILEFEEDGPRWVIVKGADGVVTRSKNCAKVATLTIHLANTSKSNDVLTVLHTTDMAIPGGSGIIAGMLRDKNGATLYIFPTMWVEGFPKDEMTDKATDRPWKLTCLDYIPFLGGT